MDYMKYLLIYMTAVLSLSVQNTTAPQETPTPAPTAVEATAELPEETEAIASPEVTPAPATETPKPVPEITPNKKYRNLARNDRGKEVKQLQERLIELGYLPEGAADGAYGMQTYRAVRAFQRNNGLTADGIAGKRTQTYLYENPDINPAVTPTPEPTPEPTAAPALVPTIAPATETPTEEPTEEPAEEPTEEPAEEPTPAPTSESTAAPTSAPTATPDPTPERTAGAPVTQAPATQAPSAEPTMTVEEIDPDILKFTEVDGKVTVNGRAATFEKETDGKKAAAAPRLQKRENRIRISLDDLAACMSGWVLTADGGNVILEAGGHTLAILNEDAGMAATLDAQELMIGTEDFEFAEGHFVGTGFLAAALDGTAEWDEKTATLKLELPAGK